MGRMAEVVIATATNPGAGGAAAAAVPGNSLTVRNARGNSKVWLTNLWRMGATAGFVSLRSPLMHDNVQGIRLRGQANSCKGLLPNCRAQDLYPQDTLAATVSGGAAEVDALAFSTYYEDLPGADAQLFEWHDIEGAIENLVGVEVSTTTAATAGQWADFPVSTSFDLLQADTDYAILGYEVDTVSVAVAVSGPATSNFRHGGPADLDRVEGRNYFMRASRDLGVPFIPVFNYADKASTNVSIAAISTGATVIVNLVCAQLNRKFTSRAPV